ncbi:MAG: arylesterase [Alphaproteobacteria bacterium]|nr:arylesterase [Alphaproteobacteria bacterium]
MKLYIAPIAVAALLAGCDAPQGLATPPVETAAADAAPDLPVMGREVRILAFGDSLLTGYGLRDREGYPARLEAALRARGINARLIDAAVSGDTSQAGAQRLAFALDAQAVAPDLAVISLGGNDMLRGLPPEETKKSLDAILFELCRREIRVVLLGMLAAPNLGQDYAGAFNPIYPALAKTHGATLVPFFMQPLVENPDLVQPDRIHPTAQGVDAMVKGTVDAVAGAVAKRGTVTRSTS